MKCLFVSDNGAQVFTGFHEVCIVYILYYTVSSFSVEINTKLAIQYIILYMYTDSEQ